MCAADVEGSWSRLGLGAEELKRRDFVVEGVKNPYRVA